MLGLIQSRGGVIGRKIFNMGYDQRGKRNPLRKKRDNSNNKRILFNKKNRRIQEQFYWQNHKLKDPQDQNQIWERSQKNCHPKFSEEHSFEKMKNSNNLLKRPNKEFAGKNPN